MHAMRWSIGLPQVWKSCSWNGRGYLWNKSQKSWTNVVEAVEATQAFNTFLVNYVAIFFVILDYFVYCLWSHYVNTNGGYFYGKTVEDIYGIKA